MELIKKYFPDISSKQTQQFQLLQSLYEEWNEKINVISRADIQNLYEKHVLHSLAIAKVIQFNPGTKVLDVGTGGGFPGIPLAILFPETSFHLVDSIAKKIKVVSEVSQALGLKNVQSETQRVEKIKSTYDFISGRAVTRLPKFHSWIRGIISQDSFNTLPNGVLYLKGGDFDDELEQFDAYRVWNILDYFEEPFFETKKVVHVPFVHKKRIKVKNYKK